MKDIVFVKGNIIGKSGCHVVKEMISLLTDLDEDNVVEVYEGDLILDDTYKAKPYCIYAATGGVVALGTETLYVLFSPAAVYTMYKKEMEKCQEFLQLSIPQHLQSDHYRHLYISIIGALELFLTELLESLVLGDRDNYTRFIKEAKFKVPLSELEESASDMQNTIHKAIHGINAHDLRTIGKVYKDVLCVDFPDYSTLGRKIKTRHDFVHRNGYGVTNKTIDYIEVTSDMVRSLMETCNLFTHQLMVNLQQKIDKWNEVFHMIGISTN